MSSRVTPSRSGQRQQQVLGGEVVVAESSVRARVGRVDDVAQLAGQAGLAAVGLGGGEPLDGGVAQRQRLQPHPLQQGQHHALGLAEQGQQQVVGGDLGVRGRRAVCTALLMASWVLCVQRFGSEWHGEERTSAQGQT